MFSYVEDYSIFAELYVNYSQIQIKNCSVTMLVMKHHFTICFFFFRVLNRWILIVSQHQNDITNSKGFIERVHHYYLRVIKVYIEIMNNTNIIITIISQEQQRWSYIITVIKKYCKQLKYLLLQVFIPICELCSLNCSSNNKSKRHSISAKPLILTNYRMGKISYENF